jgi:hypothetical protein
MSNGTQLTLFIGLSIIGSIILSMMYIGIRSTGKQQLCVVTTHDKENEILTPTFSALFVLIMIMLGKYMFKIDSGLVWIIVFGSTFLTFLGVYLFIRFSKQFCVTGDMISILTHSLEIGFIQLSSILLVSVLSLRFF